MKLNPRGSILASCGVVGSILLGPLTLSPVVRANSLLDALSGMTMNYSPGSEGIQACPSLGLIKEILKEKIAHVPARVGECTIYYGGPFELRILKVLDYHPFLLVKYKNGPPGSERTLWTYLPESILIDLLNK